MLEQSWLNAIYGGLIIGLAAAALLLTYGRVLGVSGIISGIIGPVSDISWANTFWRVMFFAGTMAGGYLGSQIWPEHFEAIISGQNFTRLAVAGVIVGFGTKMGNGCTSGHGVCGIGRLSPRGIVATCVFILTGMLTVGIIGR